MRIFRYQISVSCGVLVYFQALALSDVCLCVQRDSRSVAE